MMANPGMLRSHSRNARGTADGEIAIRVARLHDYLVPIDDSAVTRFFIRTLFAAHTTTERGLAVLARPLSAVPWQLFAEDIWSLPLSSNGAPLRRLALAEGNCSGHGTTEHPGGPGGPDSHWQTCLEMIAEALTPRTDTLRDLGSGRQPRLRWVARCQRVQNERRLILFIFDEAASTPHVVVKLRSGGRRTHPLHGEWQALRRCMELTPEVRDTAPSPIAFLQNGCGGALWLSWKPGRSAYVDLHGDVRPSRYVRRHFDAAARWLARFHGATIDPVHAFGLEQLEALVDAIRSPASIAAENSQWYRDLRAMLSRTPLPLASAHGDFWPRNLLLDGDSQSNGSGRAERVVVVDWEEFRDSAPVFIDLFTFPLTYGLAYPWSRYRRARAAEGFRQTFLEDTPVSREVRRYFERYCQELGLDLEVVRLLFPLFLLMQGSTDGSSVDNAGARRPVDEPWQTFYSLIVDTDRSVFSA